MSIAIWKNQTRLAEIKKIFAPLLTANEWQILQEIGKATGLNPFLREIYAVKYGTSPASIFIGRDGYRKSAQQHKDYEYHQSDAVYSNDKFSVENGEIKHTYPEKINERGILIGAYCVVKRRGASKPHFQFVDFKEYTTGRSVWASKPATMIKKVSEAQTLRMAFQELFSGTYDESEQWEDEKKPAKVIKAEIAKAEPVAASAARASAEKLLNQ